MCAFVVLLTQTLFWENVACHCWPQSSRASWAFNRNTSVGHAPCLLASCAGFNGVNQLIARPQQGKASPWGWEAVSKSHKERLAANRLHDSLQPADRHL